MTKTLALIVAVVVILFVVSRRREPASLHTAEVSASPLPSTVSRPEQTPGPIEASQFQEVAPGEEAPKLRPQVILLTKENFEQLVSECSAEQPCQLTVDPLFLYQDLKAQGHADSEERLIAYLKRELGDPELHEKYKDVVKKIIEDFYPATEQQFQQASFADAMGDYPKALELYLDLDQKAASDPSVRTAPRLYLANLFYKLGQDEKARDYYRQAKAELIAGRSPISGDVSSPSSGPSSGDKRADLADFIDRRLSELRPKADPKAD